MTWNGTTTEGFTLVEIVVALVILQLGALAALSLLVLAADALSEAHDVEETAWTAARVVDSLQWADSVVDGGVSDGPVEASWTVTDQGVDVTVRGAGAPTLRLRARRGGWLGVR